MQPTIKQAFACLRVCQILSNCLQLIHVFRFDEKSGEIFVLAGIHENIEIVVYRNGLWEFIDD